MPLPAGDVIGILADNLRLRRSVLPLPAKVATEWTVGLDLPRGGDTVLYTGLMYQLIPYINGLVKAETRLGDSWLAGWTGLGRRVNRLVNLSAFMARPSASDRARFNQVPVNVVHLLRHVGVEFGSLYEDDLYSGALAYDLGLDEVVAAHARRVQATLRKHRVRTLITIDPHTTAMLREVYPKVLDDFDVEVRSYLEVLVEHGFAPASAAGLLSSDDFSSSPTPDLVMHDSCVFARYAGVVDEPRRLLAASGISFREPEYAGRQTWCCGGPVESLYPAKAAANAEKRVAQLRAAGSEAVTMCPMCFVNLSSAAGSSLRVTDISFYLRDACTSHS
ncbi:MAG: (Fe-S)-binding protein [Thermoleophilia bacterium]